MEPVYGVISDACSSSGWSTAPLRAVVTEPWTADESARNQGAEND